MDNTFEKFMQWKAGEENSYITNAFDANARKMQIRDTILKSVKACNDAGRICEKDLLLTACVEDFPIDYNFAEICLNELTREKQIILCEGMLWIKGAGKLIL